MPISATSAHSEKHWSDVLQLLHRAIKKAGMDPVNVWSGELVDRVSERIIGNIFAHEIVVADISDLNPNVMLELGLRLASKKPTIVIVNEGGAIPFDIRDFHVISYPSDLNILAMEEFFERLEASLTTKIAAFRGGGYEPFLGKVVVDVLAPESRAIPFNELILERLDDLAKQVSRPTSRAPERPVPTKAPQGITSRTSKAASIYFYTVPKLQEEVAVEYLKGKFEKVEVIAGSSATTALAATNAPPTGEEDKLEPAIVSFIRSIGGKPGAPEMIADRYRP